MKAELVDDVDDRAAPHDFGAAVDAMYNTLAKLPRPDSPTEARRFDARIAEISGLLSQLYMDNLRGLSAAYRRTMN
jgi:hypothetical protein